MDIASQTWSGQSHASRRALTRALRECKHRTFTVSHCHSLTLRHVGVERDLTRSDARNASETTVTKLVIENGRFELGKLMFCH